MSPSLIHCNTNHRATQTRPNHQSEFYILYLPTRLLRPPLPPTHNIIIAGPGNQSRPIALPQVEYLIPATDVNNPQNP